MKYVKTYESFAREGFRMVLERFGMRTINITLTDMKSLNEGFMSELDIIRQESKNVKDFIKNALDSYPQLKGEEKFLEEIWNTSQEMGN